MGDMRVVGRRRGNYCKTFTGSSYNIMDTNRRNFMINGGLAGLGLLLSSFEKAPVPVRAEAAPGFALKILATNWGYAGTMDEFCARVKKEGYDGVEVWWSADKNETDTLFRALKKYGLSVGFLCGGSSADPAIHFSEFKTAIEAATSQTDQGISQRPLYINCHSGRDFFDASDNQKFIDLTNSISEKTGILICHETHRSRMLFAAHIARGFIQRNPALRLTLDISHWCNVHESLLQNQKETVDLALSRTRHIHARVGHPEGPQVNDPRAPEWQDTVNAHFAWWDAVVAAHRKSGTPLTILTEFGPADYMPTLPYTREPVANQWDINVYMMQVLRKRYAI